MRRDNSEWMIGMMTVAMIFSCSQAWAAGEKYAYVDVAKIFDNYEKTKEQDRMLQDLGKKKEEQRDALVYDIRQLKEELVLMNGDMKNKKQELLDQKIQSLQDFDQTAKKDLDEKRSEVVSEIFKDIEASIKDQGEKQGYDLIFNEKALLFQNPKLNITEQILLEINKNYKSKKK